MRIDPLGKALELCRRPATLKLGSILSLFIQLEVVCILQVSKLCVTHGTFSHDRRDKDNPVRFRQYQVTRQNDGASYANRRVDCSQRHLLNKGRIVSLVKPIEIGNSTIFFLIPDAAIKDKAGVCMRGDTVPKIGTNQSSIDNPA